MLRYHHSLYLVFALLLLFSCHESSESRCDEEPGINTEIVKIKYGASFGFCAGYCWKQLVVTTGKLAFEKMSRDDNEPVKCADEFGCTQWIPLVQPVDLNKFFGLSETIGCPDCADGGAEWIEVQTRTKRHKVTFEYNSAPTEISGLVTELRELMATFNDCD